MSRVTDILTENKTGDPSSNLERGYLPLEKERK